MSDNGTDLHLHEIAAAAVGETTGNRRAALELGRSRIRAFLEQNPERAIEIVLPMLSNKLWDAIRELLPETPRIHGGTSGPSGKRPYLTTRDNADLEAVGRDYLYEFVLPDGIKLGRATKESIEYARRAFATTAQESSRNAVWLAMISAEMQNNGKRVDECFTQERLNRMLKGAKERTAALLEGGRKELTTR